MMKGVKDARVLRQRDNLQFQLLKSFSRYRVLSDLKGGLHADERTKHMEKTMI